LSNITYIVVDRFFAPAKVLTEVERGGDAEIRGIVLCCDELKEVYKRWFVRRWKWISNLGWLSRHIAKRRGECCSYKVLISSRDV
jgi:hypothetical protein